MWTVILLRTDFYLYMCGHPMRNTNTHGECMREKPKGRSRANANKNISEDLTEPAVQQDRHTILKRIGMCKRMSLCGHLKEPENTREGELQRNLKASEWLMKCLSVCVCWKAECLFWHGQTYLPSINARAHQAATQTAHIPQADKEDSPSKCRLVSNQQYTWVISCLRAVYLVAK